MHPDHKYYHYLATRHNLKKSIETIHGLFQGIGVDQKLSEGEINFLRTWLKTHSMVANRHPYNEIYPTIHAALEDNIITEEEQQDILWLCEKLAKPIDVYSGHTQGLQRLQGLLAGIIADGKITEEELTGLAEWLEDHAHLRSCWPYDEVDSLITSIMSDGKIDEEEQQLLLSFFSEFVLIDDDKTITNPLVQADKTLSGVCSCAPTITFKDRSFCFTGAFSAHPRNTIAGVVHTLGGRVVNNVSGITNYLIIGSEGNPCWAYACYGRKVEKAISLRREGASVMLVHENDFLDNVYEQGISI
jgi:hypothetical protein